MKKRHLLITLLSTSLLLGAVAVIAFNSNNKTKGANASSLSPTTGTFQRIKNYESLCGSLGSKVIIVSDDGQAMDDVWGNPGFVHGGGEGVAFSNGIDTVTLTNSKATVFTLEAGTETITVGGNEVQSFAFKADTMCISGQRKNNIYFAHNEKEYYGDSTFENIGYFKDHDIAVETSKKTESSWFVDYTLDDEYGETVIHTHIRNAKSVKAGDFDSEVLFTYRYAPRFCSNEGTNINIYKLDDPTLYSVIVTNEPTNTDYTYGDPIDLTGLSICIRNSSGSTFVDYSESTASSFTYAPTAYGNGDVLFPISYNGMQFNITIHVSRPSLSATKVGELADYRGSYMLVEDSYGGYGLNYDKSLNYNLTYDYGNGIYNARNSDVYEDVRFTITKENGGYCLKNKNGQYLDLNDFSLGSSPVNIFIEQTSDGVKVKSSSDSSAKYLCCRMGEYQYEFATATQAVIEANDYLPVSLYRYPLSSGEQSALDAYVSNFIGTAECDETGATFTITESIWEDLADDFDDLSGTLQAELVNTTYTEGEQLSTDIQFAMSRYDYIYSKYHDSQIYDYITDFIGRNTAGTMQNLYRGSIVSPLYNLTNNNIVPIIIVVVVVISISSFGAFLLIKRKRQ